MTSDHEADVNKELRVVEAAPPQGEERPIGDSPRHKPIRKRGIWRAKKRGEHWARNWPKFTFQDMLGWYLDEAEMKRAFMAPSFISTLPKHSEWTGGYLPVPIKFGK